MLRVTIELFPRGSVTQAKVLSQIFVINDGSGDLAHGNYKEIKIKELMGATL